MSPRLVETADPGRTFAEVRDCDGSMLEDHATVLLIDDTGPTCS